MVNLKSRYQVDAQQMDQYLKNRFISVSFTFSIIMIIILSTLTFILYKHQAFKGLWTFLISVPICIGAFLYGVKRWHDKLRKLSGTEFTLTNNSIVQKIPNQSEKIFDFSEIAVVDKKKFGTTIIKGNWLTRIDYYRPKRSPYQLDDPKLIFIPNITTNYSELVGAITQERRLT